MGVEKTEATRISRTVHMGSRAVRLGIVFESTRSEGRYYVDDVSVAPTDFDRVMALLGIPDAVS